MTKIRDVFMTTGREAETSPKNNNMSSAYNMILIHQALVAVKVL